MNEQVCQRCGKEAAKDIYAPAGYQLGPTCNSILQSRILLRRSGGTGPISVHICTETKVTYWQDKRFSGICPDDISCWACSYCKRQTCEAEVAVNSHGQQIHPLEPLTARDIFTDLEDVNA